MPDGRLGEAFELGLQGGGGQRGLDCLAPGMQLMTKPFSLELLAETVARAIATPVG